MFARYGAKLRCCFDENGTEINDLFFIGADKRKKKYGIIINDYINRSNFIIHSRIKTMYRYTYIYQICGLKYLIQAYI